MRHYAIYRVDLNLLEANLYRCISAESVYDIVKEQMKLSKWSKSRGFESAYIYRELSYADEKQMFDI
jgi:hypothetical protein